jgi:hypothetical protein
MRRAPEGKAICAPPALRIALRGPIRLVFSAPPSGPRKLRPLFRPSPLVIRLRRTGSPRFIRIQPCMAKNPRTPRQCPSFPRESHGASDLPSQAFPTVSSNRRLVIGPALPRSGQRDGHGDFNESARRRGSLWSPVRLAKPGEAGHVLGNAPDPKRGAAEKAQAIS